MAPAAPKNARWTRISDQDVTIQWDKVAGATSYGIQYQKGGTENAWVRPGWTSRTTSFTARRWRVNSGYRFRVYATDKTGNSSYSNVTDTFYTPPPTPKAPTATVLAGGGLRAKWSRAGSYYPQGTELQVEGGATSVLGNGLVGAAPTELVLSVVGLGVRVRVRGFVGAAGAQTRVYGGWSPWSNAVNTLTAPNAPQVLAPSGFTGSWADTVFQWKHMPTDGTTQTGGEVRYRLVDASEWTVQTVTTPQTLSVASLPVGSYEFQVRTKGLASSWGEWSAVGVFASISRPVVTVTTPDAARSKVTAQWVWAQAEGLPQSTAVVSLLQGGDLVEQKRVTGTATNVAFKTVLSNDTAYQLRVEADCSGLAAAAKTVSWTTSFVPPAKPVISVLWVESGGFHEVTVAPGAGGSEPAVSLDVHRNTGGDWMLVEEDLPASESVVADYLGLTFGETRYRVTAWTGEGASASAVVTVETRSSRAWVRYEQAAVPIMYNPDTSYTAEKHDSSLIYFDGATVPTLIEGEGVSRSVSISGSLIPEWLADGEEMTAVQARQMLESMVVSPGVLPTLSTPDRFVVTGQLSAQFSVPSGALTRVQLSVREAQ